MISYKNLLSKVSFLKISQLHVSKHFEQLDEDFAPLLSRSQQDRNNRYKGSKFNAHFATHPLQLIDRIIASGTIVRFENVKYSKLEMEVRFSQSNFPSGIGWDSIIPITEIPTGVKQHLKKETRESSSVLVYESKEKVTTHILVLILHRHNNQWEVTTCFPGVFAPSLPHSFFKTNQLRAEATQFWKEHAFMRYQG
ncbi:MAG: hypothetical protein ACI8Q1_001085 [Parvicella sp.]|jgi:hypothetical protein